LEYSALSPEDLVVACLRSGEEAAWTEFVRRFHPLIASVVIRVCQQWGENSRQTMDDLIQETYLKFCTDRLRVLRNFKSTNRDAIFGFVKVFTANLAHDHFKAARAQKRGGASPISSTDDASNAERINAKGDPSSALERSLLVQQVGKCLEKSTSGSNSKRDMRVFWLYYRVGLSAGAIASLPSIDLSTKGVESTILRLTRAVRKQLAPRNLEDSSTNKEVEGIRPAESL